ncbi:MAG: cysteine synthase A [Alphaproteobacteria bacterium TMED89]|nr:cysteine synthase A [Rhodospirillaceae bacterium]RPH15070.1 MAG: cysteine synthase A [Alphaproteobacteria bacterium TMED89]
MTAEFKLPVREGFVDAIGNTPLIRLRKASEETGCTILGKAEFMNPGGSVKDRAALGIVQAAEASSALRPGATIVEGTAGNTGIGIAHVAAARGYKATIVMPETQSQEKKDTLRQLGAELILVPAVPYRDPNNYVKWSARLAEERAAANPGMAIWANQFDNTANRDAHEHTTGPEILRDLDGKVDGFICAVGSGGTLGGVALALRAANPNVKIGLVDPFGAALFAYYTEGEFKSEGGSITEGIGQGRITANLEGFSPDFAYRVSDEEMLSRAYQLMQEEGMFLGGSAALNVAGAIKMAADMPKGSTIVTVLCDSGGRYASKMYNPDFLRGKNLPTPPWMGG